MFQELVPLSAAALAIQGQSRTACAPHSYRHGLSAHAIGCVFIENHNQSSAVFSTTFTLAIAPLSKPVLFILPLALRPHAIPNLASHHTSPNPATPHNTSCAQTSQAAWGGLATNSTGNPTSSAGRHGKVAGPERQEVACMALHNLLHVSVTYETQCLLSVGGVCCM